MRVIPVANISVTLICARYGSKSLTLVQGWIFHPFPPLYLQIRILCYHTKIFSGYFIIKIKFWGGFFFQLFNLRIFSHVIVWKNMGFSLFSVSILFLFGHLAIFLPLNLAPGRRLLWAPPPCITVTVERVLTNKASWAVLISKSSLWWTCSFHRVEELLISMFSLVHPQCRFCSPTSHFPRS